MNWKFDSSGGLVMIEVNIEKSGQRNIFRMALDTGATHTFIRTRQLESLGYEPSQSPNKTTVTTGSDQAYVPVVAVEKILALGQERENMPVTAMELPASASIDGVLGLDFVRGHVLTIDFQNGEIHLS